jgi:salicylate hydroxylase
MHVAIAGAGIAGLTSAIALARRGFTVSLFERAPALQEIGAGIQLSPNATAVLHRLDLMEALRPHAVEPEAIEIRNGITGWMLAAIPLGATARRRYGMPYWLIHRADLQAVLLDAAQREARIELRLGCAVHGLRETQDGVFVDIGGAEESRADILAAADGVHSQLRTKHFGNSGARPLGHSAWRATVPAGVLAGAGSRPVIGLWLGRAAHIVQYPVEGGRSTNVVVIAKSGSREASPPSSPFGAEAYRLLDTIPSWDTYPLFDTDWSEPWVRGRSVLVGDAAHAMPPSAAQGGAQAIEDAWTLADTLAGISRDVVAALHAYGQRRRHRITRVARAARRNLRVFGMTGPSAFARDAILRALPASVLLRRLDWLFRAAAR